MTETRIRVKTTLGVTDHNLLDNRFEDNQHTINAISGLEEALESKQDILTAGDNVTIEEGVISATDTTYTAGENVAISEENVISASVPEYTAGENISISNGVISATDTTYTAGTGIAITNGVISNTQTSAEWGNIDGDMNSQTDLKNALDAKANSSDLATVATSGSYTDLADKPNIANGVLTIQKNGTTVDTFTANSSDNKTVNLIIPTSAADVSAMPDSVKYGTSITVSIDSTDYRITTTLKDQDGNTLGTAQVIDLPLESVVVSGSYDSTNKNVVLTLQDGSDITFSVADLVSGLQSEITVQNKLDADLVDDSTSVNKFVTASDKTTWNGKQDAISDLDTIRAGANAGATAVQASDLATVATSGNYSDLNGKPNLATVATSGNYSDLNGTPVIPTVPQNDNETININAQNKLQAIGFKEARTDTAMRVWHGSEQQWEQGGGQVTFYNWQNVSATLTTGTFPDYSGTDLSFVGFVEGNGVTILYNYNSDDYYTTTDGINYTKHQFGMGTPYKDVVFGNGIFMLILADIYPGRSVYTSTDGITWTATGGTISSYGYLTYCNGKWMVNGTNKIFTSIDNGVTWTSIDVDFSGHRIVYGNNLYIAIASSSNDTVKYSSDGENWNSYANTSFYCNQLTFTNGKFICMAINENYGSSPSGLSYSIDNGETWSSLNLGYYTSSFVIKNNNLYMTHGKHVNDTYKPELLEINANTMRISAGFIINSESLAIRVSACDNKILFVASKDFCGNLDLENTIVSNAYTIDRSPTTSSHVYSEPNVQSALTVTTGGSSSITLSDSKTYNYNQSGNQTTYTSVGQAHPDYLCNIDGVGVKIGTTDIANKSLTYSAGTNVSISNTGVISAIDTTYPVFGGADGSVAGHSGLVPTPANTDNDKFLKGDGTWATVSGGGSGIQNTATGTNSLTILGTATNYNRSINIGYGSQINSASEDECGLAIGVNAVSNDYSVAIGCPDHGDNPTTIDSSALGATAIGSGATVTADYSIAIGYGATSTSSNEFIVGFGLDSYKLLDGTTGKIPNDRINVDSAPTQNSTNFVTSGTIYSVLGDIETLINAL